MLRIKPGLAVDAHFSPRYEPKHGRERWREGDVSACSSSASGGRSRSWSWSRASAKGTTLVISDKGRAAAAAEVERLLAAGQRVVALDLFYFGEGHPKSHGYLWALMLATVGDRRSAFRRTNYSAVARWAGQGKPVTVVADGPRSERDRAGGRRPGGESHRSRRGRSPRSAA